MWGDRQMLLVILITKLAVNARRWFTLTKGIVYFFEDRGQCEPMKKTKQSWGVVVSTLGSVGRSHRYSRKSMLMYLCVLRRSLRIYPRSRNDSWQPLTIPKKLATFRLSCVAYIIYRQLLNQRPEGSSLVLVGFRKGSKAVHIYTTQSQCCEETKIYR